MGHGSWIVGVQGLEKLEKLKKKLLNYNNTVNLQSFFHVLSRDFQVNDGDGECRGSDRASR